MTGPPLLDLEAGKLRLSLAPATGGAIARFDWTGRGGTVPILRGAEGEPGSVLDAASFPLVPFCNRIRGGAFRFRGREVGIAPNMPPDPSPLHGQGWLSPWDVAARSKAGAELVFRHEAGEWPWDYEARQHFVLDSDGLGVALTCTNRSDAPMPCGLGQHPYFPCTAETRLETEVATVWTVDEHVLPVEEVPARGRYDLGGGRACGRGLDNGFGGWNGCARIAAPHHPFAIEMSSPDARYFQLYSPRAGGLFVAEPVSHANAALNEPEGSWPELGLRILAPGEAMTLRMRIEVMPA